MKKQDRQLIFNKYGGKCAYCGCDLVKGWCVDHIVAIYRGWNEHVFNINPQVVKGEDSLENWNPACRRCNLWKSTFTLEQFRYEISQQVERARGISSNFRMAVDYGLLQIIYKPVVFYFETIEQT